jgi:hypothetical protein
MNSVRASADPWKRKPDVDPEAWPDWAALKGQGTAALSTKDYAAAKRFYLMAAASSDLSLVLAKCDPDVPAVTGIGINSLLWSIRDEGRAQENPFGALPDEVLELIMTRVLALQPVRYSSVSSSPDPSVLPPAVHLGRDHLDSGGASPYLRSNTCPPLSVGAGAGPRGSFDFPCRLLAENERETNHGMRLWQRALALDTQTRRERSRYPTLRPLPFPKRASAGRRLTCC